MAWLSDPRAGFVIAAYSVAGVILISVLTISLLQNKKTKKELHNMQERLKAKK